jgi:hypothetical protein
MIKGITAAKCESEVQPPPSLRANGSRECAPDDRLREAIHSHRGKKVWIASSQALLAMTDERLEENK